MSSEKGTGELSQFGRCQVRRIAEEKAQVIDERNVTWRYFLESMLAFLIPISAIAVAGSLFLVAYSHSVDGVAPTGVAPLVSNTAILVVSYYLRPRVANPDVNVKYK
jgi:hypothetical protein